MKGNECSLKLYIYTYIVVCGCGFSVIQVKASNSPKASKFTENVSFKRTESQEEIQTT